MFKTKEIFLSEENFPVCKRALKVMMDFFPVMLSLGKLFVFSHMQRLLIRFVSHMWFSILCLVVFIHYTLFHFIVV